MQEKLEHHLKKFKTKFDARQRMLAEMEAKQNSLKQILLRINGAIQMLHEKLGRENGVSGNGEMPSIETKQCVEMKVASDA